jgi:hypothetical protein
MRAALFRLSSSRQDPDCWALSGANERCSLGGPPLRSNTSCLMAGMSCSRQNRETAHQCRQPHSTNVTKSVIQEQRKRMSICRRWWRRSINRWNSRAHFQPQNAEPVTGVSRRSWYIAGGRRGGRNWIVDRRMTAAGGISWDPVHPLPLTSAEPFSFGTTCCSAAPRSVQTPVHRAWSSGIPQILDAECGDRNAT